MFVMKCAHYSEENCRGLKVGLHCLAVLATQAILHHRKTINSNHTSQEMKVLICPIPSIHTLMQISLKMFESDLLLAHEK